MIKCTTYGGKIGWFLRKHFSRYTSWAYLQMQYLLRIKKYNEYIKFFYKLESDNQIPLPCLISIETINRCNSTCGFCPASKDNESRPFMKMDEKLFYKIIEELSELNYEGYLNLYVNNEPFMDVRIVDWYKYAKEKLPKAKMLLYTNGLLLDIDKFVKICPYIDKMVINNYSDDLRLHSNIEKLYSFIKDKDEYKNKDISIQIRYIKEILTNRAGAAPNKGWKKSVHMPCIMPFTDFTVYPNGIVGLCCSDALEKTNFGDINNQSIYEIWVSDKYKLLRNKIGSDRETYNFCKGCDFVDAGIRNDFIDARLKNKMK